MKRVICFLLLLVVGPVWAQGSPGLQRLAREFFAWRARTQPASGDDVLRVERPDGWTPDYSPEALARYRERYRAFKQRLEALPKAGWTRADSVDYLLLRSAIERVHWELDVLRLPHRNPDFYVHQTLGILYELLLIHTPMTETRARNLLVRLRSFSATLAHARRNLTEPVAAFADIALANLEQAYNWGQSIAAVREQVAPELQNELTGAYARAHEALQHYEAWLRRERPKMRNDFSVGREAYEHFLRTIALLPYAPEALLRMGRQAWHRAVAFETYERQRNRDLPPAKIFPTVEAQIEQARRDEQAIRRFLEAQDIMTVPDWLQHYRNEPIPPRLAPLTHLGVLDDLTSESRLQEDAVRYLPQPSPNLSFFQRASAQDPRPIIVHEGIPGHYFQLARSWAHPDPIRRRYFDSGPIEGIGFYVEELMLQFGLFNDRPHTREIIYRFCACVPCGWTWTSTWRWATTASKRPPVTSPKPCPWTNPPPGRRPVFSPSRPVRPSPTKSANCRFCNSSPTPASSSVTASACALFTTI